VAIVATAARALAERPTAPHGKIAQLGAVICDRRGEAPHAALSLRTPTLLTIDTWLNGIGLTAPITDCPAWPPDLFALAGTLIHRGGAYLRVFEHPGSSTYLEGIDAAAKKWRDRLDAITARPVTPWDLELARVPEVESGWACLIEARERPLNAINEAATLVEQLIRLTLIADAASRGIGVTWNNTTPEAGSEPSEFLLMAGEALSYNDNRSYCREVPPKVLCVLGKQHTPAKGATFRSLSHHLALSYPGEIEARWILASPKTTEPASAREGLNLLLLPWPERVETSDFHEAAPGAKRTDGSEPPGYFRFDPKKSDAPEVFGRRLQHALRLARQHAGPIDAVVFPELALTELQYKEAERIAFDERTILICGVRQAGQVEGEWDANLCILQAAGAVREAQPDPVEGAKLREDLRRSQAKHHRWYLDRTQIVNYQLAGALPAARGAWEHIELAPPRVLHFVTVNAITWSVLICEDLARQDPAAELVRAVGPNLLIALLMDGPQLSHRWPARYAAVLAEDPGTSILTLTSLGMVERSRPILGSGERAPVSRAIALWRDAIAGEIQIALDPGHNACVLSLECRMQKEYCADGRSDHGQARYPVYAGYCSFEVPEEVEEPAKTEA